MFDRGHGDRRRWWVIYKIDLPSIYAKSGQKESVFQESEINTYMKFGDYNNAVGKELLKEVKID